MKQEWAIMRLGDAATFINGYPFKPSDWSNIGLPIIRIQNLTESSQNINYYAGQIDKRYDSGWGCINIMVCKPWGL